MARTEIKANKVSFSTLALKRAVAQDPEARKAVGDKFRKGAGKKLARIVGEHYHAAIKGAAMAARDGVPGGSTGISKVQIPTPLGSAPVGPWDALSADYMIRKLRVRGEGVYNMFWRFKHAAYRLLWNAAGRVTLPGITAVKVVPSSGGKSQSTVQLTSRLTVPSSGNETLDIITQKAFVQGLPSAKGFDEAVAAGKSTFFDEFGGVTKKLSPEGIVAAADRRRPLVSKLAEVMGARARTALRKISQ